MAVRLARIAADGLVARARGREPVASLPESLCHVRTSIEPPEAMRIEAGYRLRGDGLIVQSVRQHDDPQPRGEDLAWLRGLRDELFATAE